METLTGLFHDLLGQTIVSLARVTLIQNGEQDDRCAPLMDTLLISLSNDVTFELLVGQESIRFEQLQTLEDLFAGFDLEPTEKLAIATSEKIAMLPQQVDSLTEIWAGEANTQFLVAVSFWNEYQQHIISVCTEGDEAEIMTLDGFRQRLDEMLFSYGRLSQQLYSSQPQSHPVIVPRSA
jgi:hypothetical protein